MHEENGECDTVGSMSRPTRIRSVLGCGRKHEANGYCQTHNKRAKAGKPLDTPIRDAKNKQLCIVGRCWEPQEAKDLCHGHYERVRKGSTDTETPLRLKRPKGEGHITRAGYRQITVSGHVILEHRHVMQQMIGRKLHRFENVHHKNGMRLDNRP